MERGLGFAVVVVFLVVVGFCEQQVAVMGEVNSKRVALVYSELARSKMWGGGNEKAYVAAYASVQHQLIMSGIPFDLVDDADLINADSNGFYEKYAVIVFTKTDWVNSADLQTLELVLQAAVFQHGIGIVAAGGVFTNDENGAAFNPSPYARSEAFIGMTVTGQFGSVSSVEMISTAGGVHPILLNYPNNAVYDTLSSSFYEEFQPVVGPHVTSAQLLVQLKLSSDTFRNGVWAVEMSSGARHVHFGSLELMLSGNLLWSSVLWSYYGDMTTHPWAGLKISRDHESLLIGRNDMELAHHPESFDSVLKTLYETYITQYYANYDFVGSYFASIGGDTSQYTDWTKNGPIYNSMLDLENTLGSHSYTMPNTIDGLSDAQKKFEYEQILIDFVGNVSSLSGATPTRLETALHKSVNIDTLEYFDDVLGLEIVSPLYEELFGGRSSSGFGFLKPNGITFMMTTNLEMPDTLVIDQDLSPSQTESYWRAQYEQVLAKASQPIVVWPWNDYGITLKENGYRVRIFRNTIEFFSNQNVEFITGTALRDRVVNFMDVQMSTSYDSLSSSLTVQINGASELGYHSIHVDYDPSMVISSVVNWYAYSSSSVFLPSDGGIGSFQIILGTATDDDITRITKLPARARLIDVSGDGINIFFEFYGKGTVEIILSEIARLLGEIICAADVTQLVNSTLILKFNTIANHICKVVVPTSQPSTSPSSSPTTSPSRSPSRRPTNEPSRSPTRSPSLSPTTLDPTPSPTQSPSSTPTPAPSLAPSKGPTSSPTRAPSTNPTDSPTSQPTRAPTTPKPSSSPTLKPTAGPTPEPTPGPTPLPTPSPSNSPTVHPTSKPTATPTPAPTNAPSQTPTAAPTGNPTLSPTQQPTPSPTPGPSEAPSPMPTQQPTPSPTPGPSEAPSPIPTQQPTPSPTPGPSEAPSPMPTQQPTPSPTPGPSEAPSLSPSKGPSRSPSREPTGTPTLSPSVKPSSSPTMAPTTSPTPFPTVSPNFIPTNSPTDMPTVTPPPTFSGPYLEFLTLTFKQADTNGDFVLSQTEFYSYFTRAGPDLYDAMDTDSNGITVIEFIAYLESTGTLVETLLPPNENDGGGVSGGTIAAIVIAAGALLGFGYVRYKNPNVNIDNLKSVTAYFPRLRGGDGESRLSIFTVGTLGRQDRYRSSHSSLGTDKLRSLTGYDEHLAKYVEDQRRRNRDSTNESPPSTYVDIDSDEEDIESSSGSDEGDDGTGTGGGKGPSSPEPLNH